MTEQEKMQKCGDLAALLRMGIRHGDTMHPDWELIFDLEAWARGCPEQVFLRDHGIDWYISYTEGMIMRRNGALE